MDPATPTPKTPPATRKPMLRPMEKVMLGMTGFFALGIIIFGFLPPDGFRGMVMTGYVLLFVAFIYNPFGVKDRQNRNG